ncbi:hypothetical protein FRC03_007768 [Tulasnella sp. 419]|nr:hypothetical protein FRC02_003510 [Tulasnella sp. 418]KAG8959579.1 hypothetical protein FRC03_007768 [Tulasnella sp. 419]
MSSHKSKDDPRDASLGVKISLPKSWTSESDATASLAMLLAGVTMFTRNTNFAWITLFVAVNGWINQHPKRLKEGGQSLVAVFAAIGCLLTANMPRFILQTPVPPKQ